YLGLLVSLLAGYFYALNREFIAFGSPFMSLIVSCILLTIPLFFAGIIFSTLLAKSSVDISTALAYNLIGALFGGIMEYNSMYFGFAFLYLLAIGFYTLALVTSRTSAARM